MPKRRTARERLESDAELIARRYLAGKITIKGLMLEYHAAYRVVISVLERRTTPARRRAITHARRVESNKPTRFKIGHRPWNAGRKGYCPPGCEKGWFKPGVIRGAAARNWRPVGTVVIRYDKAPKHRRRKLRKRKPGSKRVYTAGKPRRWIKVRDDGPTVGRWMCLARWLWQRIHGPVAPGKLVVHVDGDILNDDVANLALVDHREHLLLEMSRDPAMLSRRRLASAAAQKLRHETNCRRKGLHADFTRWECPACGWHADERRPPAHCPKCNGGAFEKLTVVGAGRKGE